MLTEILGSKITMPWAIIISLVFYPQAIFYLPLSLWAIGHLTFHGHVKFVNFRTCWIVTKSLAGSVQSQRGPFFREFSIHNSDPDSNLLWHVLKPFFGCCFLDQMFLLAQRIFLHSFLAACLFRDHDCS